MSRLRNIPPLAQPTMARIPPPLVQPVQFMVFNILWTYIASIVTGNVSQVDRVWTFLPTLYTAYYAFYPLLDGADPSIKSHGVSPRTLLMLALQVCHHRNMCCLKTNNLANARRSGCSAWATTLGDVVSSVCTIILIFYPLPILIIY